MVLWNHSLRTIILKSLKYMCFLLLSNCTKQSANDVRTEYIYPAILYGYLDSWLFCTVEKNLFNQSAARTSLLYPLCFSRLMRNEQKDLEEKKALRSRQNTAQLIKYSAIHTKTSNKIYILFLFVLGLLLRGILQYFCLVRTQVLWMHSTPRIRPGSLML